MKNLPFVFAAVIALSASSCSKQADPESKAGSNKAADAAPPLHAGDEQLSVTQKGGPDQNVSIHRIKPGERAQTMAPQPVLINGQPATIRPTEAVAEPDKVKQAPGQISVTQTPAARAEMRTQAMEEMLRARKQAEAAASKK